MGQSYHDHVKAIEAGLSRAAKLSFEPFSDSFVDGDSISEYYERLWSNPEQRAGLVNRTPIQIERDRILFSGVLRKQTEKYHVLYNGQRRIARNFTTHTMRAAHVTRAICQGLGLNPDFGESIALGMKVGATPFVHASKSAVSEWVVNMVSRLDEAASDRPPANKSSGPSQLVLGYAGIGVPFWIRGLSSPTIGRRVQESIPWAAGLDVDPAYTAGQESYWLLSVNPFTRTPRQKRFLPETMLGVWRHTLGLPIGPASFQYKQTFGEFTNEINWTHITYEAIVAQYADDITWAIENLNDANAAAVLNAKSPDLYIRLSRQISSSDVSKAFGFALTRSDASELYTYFISDFVQWSVDHLQQLGTSAEFRQALRDSTIKSPPPPCPVGLSDEGRAALNAIIDFLKTKVFLEPRVKNRFEMLRISSRACVQLLYDGSKDALPQILEDRGDLERWTDEQKEIAESLISDEVHRIQLAVDVFAEMGDQEIYDFVGIQAL